MPTVLRCSSSPKISEVGGYITKEATGLDPSASRSGPASACGLRRLRLVISFSESAIHCCTFTNCRPRWLRFRQGRIVDDQTRRGPDSACCVGGRMFAAGGGQEGGVTERTLRKRLQDPEFQAALVAYRVQPSGVTGSAFPLVVVDRYRADDLVGVAEIAGRFGVGTSVVHDWRRWHAYFPSPVRQLQIGFVWSWHEVERWAHETGRLP